MGTVVVGLVLVCVVSGIVLSMVHSKKSGKSCSGCSSCSMCEYGGCKHVRRS